MRPSRIIIGEVREAESLDMLVASLCSQHLTPVRCTGASSSSNGRRRRRSRTGRPHRNRGALTVAGLARRWPDGLMH